MKAQKGRRSASRLRPPSQEHLLSPTLSLVESHLVFVAAELTPGSDHVQMVVLFSSIKCLTCQSLFEFAS